MRYRLRSLLILLAVLPPLLWFGWGKYQAWRAEWERQQAQKRIRPAPGATKPARDKSPEATTGPADLGPWYPGVAGDEGPPGIGQQIVKP